MFKSKFIEILTTDKCSYVFYYALAVALFLSICCSAQPINFNKPTMFSIVSSTIIGGDYCNLNITTSDGGVLSCGGIDSNNAIVSKLKANGSLEWETIVNRDSSIDISSLSEDENGNYLALGYIHSTGNSPFGNGAIRYAAKLDKNGTVIWQHLIDSSASRYISAWNPIIMCRNNKYATIKVKAANYTTLHLLPSLTFYDERGMIVKEVIYDSLHTEKMGISPFFQTKDSGFGALFHGELHSTTFTQFWRLDSNGALMWKKEWIDLQYSQLSFNSSAIESEDGGFIVATTAPKNFDTCRIILRKFDANGNLLFIKQYGIKIFNAVSQIVETPNRDILVIGYTNDVVGKYTTNNIFLLRTNLQGKVRWQESFGDSTTGDYGKTISMVDDHTFYISFGTGRMEFDTSGTKPYIAKISDLPSSVADQPASYSSLSPNPVSSSFTVSGLEGISAVKVFNNLGVIVGEWGEVRGTRVFDISNLSNGVYFVQFLTQAGIVSKAIVVLH